jgi:hypothetical protein
MVARTVAVSAAAGSSFGGIAAEVVIGICLVGSLVVLIIQWRRMR